MLDINWFAISVGAILISVITAIGFAIYKYDSFTDRCHNANGIALRSTQGWTCISRDAVLKVTK